MQKALSVMNLINRNEKVVPFEGRFKALIGSPILKGAWIVWGQSSNGKTRFVIQLAKYLSQFGKVAYDSLEEGVGESIRRAFVEENMLEVNGQLVIINREGYDDIVLRLRKKRSPRVIIIDSLQYMGLSFAQYKKLKDEFPYKLFIVVSHAQGKLPEGRIANKIRFDAMVKIRVEGYKAFAQSRYGTSNEPYVVWEQGARNYWGEDKEGDGQ